MRLRSVLYFCVGLPFLLLSLTSCSSSASLPDIKPQQQAVIKFVAADYSSGTKPVLERLVRNFMRENPSISVELQVVNWDIIDGVYISMISEDDPPDLLNMNMYARFAAHGLLNDMNDLMSDQLKAKLSPRLTQMDRLNGKQYAIPYFATLRKLHYNPQLFRAAGIAAPPRTWSELEHDAARLKRSGVEGFGVDLTENEIPAYLSYFFHGAGGGWFKNGHWTINSPQNVAALTYLKHLVERGLTDAEPTVTTRDEKQRIMGTGRLGMMISGTYFETINSREFPGSTWASSAIPVKDGQPAIHFGVQDVLVSFKTDHTNREALSKFLDYLYNDEQYEELVRQEGMLPVTTTVAEQMTLQDASMEQPMEELEQALFYPIQQPEWSDILDMMRKMGDAVLYDGIPPQVALNRVQHYAEQQQALYKKGVNLSTLEQP